jgi:hypothetical protein
MSNMGLDWRIGRALRPVFLAALIASVPAETWAGSGSVPEAIEEDDPLPKMIETCWRCALGRR